MKRFYLLFLFYCYIPIIDGGLSSEAWLSAPDNGNEDKGEADDEDAASDEGVLTHARRIASVLFGSVKFQVRILATPLFSFDKRSRPWNHGLHQFFDVAFCSAAKLPH